MRAHRYQSPVSNAVRAIWLLGLGLLAPLPLWAVTVSGTVTDANTGVPVGSALVSVSMPVINQSASTLSAADGSYSLQFNQQGEATLSSTAIGYLGQSRTIVLPPGNQVVTEDVSLVPQRFVTGQLVDDDTGLPLSGRRSVRLYNQSGQLIRAQQTEEGGRFVFDALPDSPVAVCVIDASDAFLDECWEGRQAQFLDPLQIDDFTLIQPTLDANGTLVTLRLKHGASIRGRFVDRLTGAPIANHIAYIVLYDSLGRRLVGFANPRTDADGGFVVEGLAPVPHYLSASIHSPHYTHSVYPGVDCIEHLCNALDGSVIMPSVNGTDRLSTFALYPGGDISGRITAADSGQALAGIDVELLRAGFSLRWSTVAQATTDAAGNYRFTHLANGSYRVTTRTRSSFINQSLPGGPCFVQCGTQPTAAGLPLSMNQSLPDQDISLGLGVAVRGRAHQPGLSFSAMRITLFNEQGSALQTVSGDHAGQFHFNAWLPGTYYAQATNQGALCERYMGFDCLTTVTDTTPIILSNPGDIAEIEFSLPVEVIQLDSFE